MSRFVGRLVCLIRGHDDYHTSMLPEEAFGLYAYSRIWCPRCGGTIEERPIEDQIEVLMGYVYLWNDVRPVVEAAKRYHAAEWAHRLHEDEPVATPEHNARVDEWRAADAAFRAALAKYEELYPEHVAA